MIIQFISYGCLGNRALVEEARGAEIDGKEIAIWKNTFSKLKKYI